MLVVSSLGRLSSTNIAETIHYLVTGESLDINRPKLDTTDINVEAVTGS